MLTINGETAPFRAGMTVLELLAERGFRPERVAVERNGEVVPRAAFGETALTDGDRLEIVRFVGGG